MTRQSAWAKAELSRLRSSRGNVCSFCGERLAFDANGRPNLQFAHRRPTGLCGQGRGMYARVLDIRRHPDAYDLLCSDCHLEFDAVERVNA